MNQNRLLLGIIFLLSFSINIFCQSVELKYRERTLGSDQSVRIHFSDKYGNETVSPDSIAKSEYFYFCIIPIGDWTFGTKDINRYIEPIKLKQGGSIIAYSTRNPIQSGKNISKVVLAFNKNDLDYLSDFNFENELGYTESINISEKYWPLFNEYEPVFRQGKETFELKEYLMAFQILKNFLMSDSLAKELSIYETADSLAIETINQYTTNKDNKFKELTAELEESLEDKTIDKLEMLSMELLAAQKNFSPYFDFKSDSALAVKQEFEQLIENLNSGVSDYNAAYRDSKLSIFEEGNYIDYKFELFVDLLAHMILDIQLIYKIDGYNGIDVDLIDKYPNKKQQLEELDWLTEFTDAVRLINEDIRTKNHIFGQSTMDNLKSQRQYEKQPYYNIFMTFNALANDDMELFVGSIREAYKTVSNEELLYTFELWYVSYLATVNNIPDKVLVTLADVIRYENEGNYDESIKQCKIAVRLSSGFSPPLFFLGRIYHKKEEGFIAERYFGQALEILPDYMAPRLFKIRSLIKLEDFPSALSEVDSALANLPYWYFYFTKAQVLVHLNKYDEARNIILENCIPLNKYHFDSFILLGDICVSLKDVDCAKDYYLQAGDIDPENPTFSVKMNELKNIKFTEPEPEEKTPEPEPEEKTPEPETEEKAPEPETEPESETKNEDGKD